MTELSGFIRRSIRKVLDLLLPRSRDVQFLEQAGSHRVMERLRPATDGLPGIISLFDYRDPLVKTLIWEIKFKANQELAKLAAALLYEHLLSELTEMKLFSGGRQVLIVPVPLAPGRLRERGFNQAERMAKEMEKLDGGRNFAVQNVAQRIKETTSQTKTQSRRDRQENMRGAFRVINEKTVRGKNIVVLDDVATTGSTIDELARALKEAGASSVTGFTFAH